MAQRRYLRSLAAMAVLRRSAVHLAQPKEARPIPRRPCDGAGDARKAPVGLAVPEESVFRPRDVVGDSLPFAPQDGAGSRQGGGGKLGRIVAVAERTGEQPVELLGDRPGRGNGVPFLSRIRKGERKSASSERGGGLPGKPPPVVRRP